MLRRDSDLPGSGRRRNIPAHDPIEVAETATGHFKEAT
jgi:hypothetical protein